MDRCTEIFNRIKAQGLAAINSFIEDRVSEELFLDFKRSADDGEGAKLHIRDRQNFSKCISGFGNSQGGVVVWGVDCSNDGTGADVAHTLFPIQDPQKYQSLLEGVVSGCTIPPHTEIQHYSILKPNGTGYVASFIPKSNVVPIHSVQKKQYYIRAGSSFVPTPHDVLSGMFGRRPQPKVYHHFRLFEPYLESGSLKVSLDTMLHNEGPGIAEDLYAVFRMEQMPSDSSVFEFDVKDKMNWTGMWEFERQMTMITKPGTRLPPTANLQPFIIRLTFTPPFDRGFSMSGTFGASNTMQYEFKTETSLDEFQHLYDLFVARQKNNSFRSGEKHEIAAAILKIKENKSE